MHSWNQVCNCFKIFRVGQSSKVQFKYLTAVQSTGSVTCDLCYFVREAGYLNPNLTTYPYNTTCYCSLHTVHIVCMEVCVTWEQWAVRINYGTFSVLKLSVCVTLTYKRFIQTVKHIRICVYRCDRYHTIVHCRSLENVLHYVQPTTESIWCLNQWIYIFHCFPVLNVSLFNTFV